MKDFANKVAVITGASNGIGFGIAEKCALMGMKVVLAGINMDNLKKAEAALTYTGAETLCVQVDVSKYDDIVRLSEKTIEKFSEVHLLVNNAGVFSLGSVWEIELEDWEWVIGVNLWGVIYGVHIFVPIMLAQNTECHIVNISSLAGLTSTLPSASYQVSKHGVTALTENLYYSLIRKGTKVRASVVCPGDVKTHIIEADRNRPESFGRKSKTSSPEEEEILEQVRESIEEGMTVRDVSDIIINGIREEQLYVLTHPEWNSRVSQRIDNILNQRNPL
jgi:NADP-dependent 3-hydroxy acid dehydrogenase YdfG